MIYYEKSHMIVFGLLSAFAAVSVTGTLIFAVDWSRLLRVALRRVTQVQHQIVELISRLEQ